MQIPFTHKDVLEFICDQATFALMEIDILKRQLEMLITHQGENLESVSLSVVDLGGTQ